MRQPYLAVVFGFGMLLCLALTGTATEMMGLTDVRALIHEPPLATDVVKQVEVAPKLLLLSPGENEEWLEGAPVTIRWATAGPIQTVRLYYYGDQTSLGGRDCGSFSGLIADSLPNQAFYTWQVPWVDARSFMLRLAGYDAQGKLVAETERPVRFRPAEAAGLSGTFIVVSKDRQRLWYYRDGELKWISIVSTAEAPYSTPCMQPACYGRRGEMGRVFYKDPDAFSHMYQCHMLWWMAITSSGSHGIHATSPPFYDRLGAPASHGCIRQHRRDAKVLYDMVKVGTPVYVF